MRGFHRRFLGMGVLAFAVTLGLALLLPFEASAGSLVTVDSPATGADAGSEQVYVAGTTNFDYARQVVDRVNAERSAAGIAPVTIDAELTNAAMLRAAETVALFSHMRPNGTLCDTVSDKVMGENIAYGYANPTQVMRGWMDSEGHRSNILKSSYQSIGVGCIYVNGVYFWVQLFGGESGSGSIPSGTYSVTMPTFGVTESETWLRYAMQRLYNQWTGEHFYTSSIPETYALMAVGWIYEGVGWTAPRAGSSVYRLYNSFVPGGDHHYTLSASERDALVSVGWTTEGTGWMSASDDEGNPLDGAVPLYRQYNPYATTGTHNYTADKQENDALVSVGWVPEGIAWYGV